MAKKNTKRKLIALVSYTETKKNLGRNEVKARKS